MTTHVHPRTVQEWTGLPNALGSASLVHNHLPRA